MYKGTDYIHLPGSQKVLIPGTGVTFTKTYGAGVLGNGTEEHRIDASGGATCPLPMTRAALITLRNASGLLKDCDYVITDHVQGRLVAGTQIHLQAVSANELSESVAVNTTYDNEAWFGIYDIDRGIVMELHDNRMNIARGFSGTEVSNFDWGNVNITDTTVDNAVWNTTIGAPRLVNGVNVLDGSTLTTTGQVGGTLQRVTLSDASIADLTGANVSLASFDLDNGTQANLATFTAGSVLSNYKLANGAFIDFSGSTSGVSLTNVTLDNSSSISHIGVSTGTITGSNFTMTNNSQIQHSNGAGNLSLNRSDITGSSRVWQSQGVVALADYTLDGQSAVQQITGVGGNTTLSTGFMNGQSTMTNQGAYNINATRYQAQSQGIVSIANGAVGIATLTGSHFHSTSQLSVTAGSTAGNITITNSLLDNFAVISKTGTGALSITETTVNSNSRVSVTNARGLAITRGLYSNLVQISQSGTGAVTDSLIDAEADTRGVYNLSSSGAVGHTLNYTRVNGLGGNINIGGTSTGQTLTRIKADASTWNFINNIANSYSNGTLIDGSTANITGMTVAKTLNNVQARIGCTLNVTNPTGAGALTNLVLDNASVMNINGTAGAGNILTARDGATLTFNGGNASQITKQMAGVLTTGAFNHTNVVMINHINATLTANNTGRSSYLGVVSSVPLI